MARLANKRCLLVGGTSGIGLAAARRFVEEGARLVIAGLPDGRADLFAARVPIKVLPPPVAMPQFGVCIHWHERYHHDPAIRWMRRAFVDLFSDQRR